MVQIKSGSPFPRPLRVSIDQLRPDAKLFLIPVVVLLLAGCTSYYGAASFKSTPDGVSIYDMEDGSVIGVTPVDHVWRSDDARRKYMHVRLHKPGYRDSVKAFWLALDYNSADDAARNAQPVHFELNKTGD